ncbi:MAG: sigma-70 family RNA polymerase sigma factor [Nannocystaceae bacterium]|nr:sigma-70 family RNA polymerase sigma factor [Nannocystaceae bacterium]
MSLEADDIVRFLDSQGVDVGGLPEHRLDEIVLARWYASGAPQAAEAFLIAFGELLRAIGVRSLRADEVDDYQQRVLIHFLVSQDDGAPKIGRYSGRGSLHGFVRTVASRLAVDLRRTRGVEPLVSDLESRVAEGLDPGAQFESAQTKSIIVGSLTRALRSLKPEERRALRMRYVLGFSVARTAEALGIHKISVTRLVTRVRNRLFRQVQADLAQDSADIAPPILALLSRSLDISLTRWLQTTSE